MTPDNSNVEPARSVIQAGSDPAAVATLVHEALDNAKAVDVAEIEVGSRTSITDYMIIASGTSTRHIRTLADAVVVESKKAGLTVLGVEGDKDSEWVLVDLADVLVHLMLPRARAFYNLEKLWADGPGEEAATN